MELTPELIRAILELGGTPALAAVVCMYAVKRTLNGTSEKIKQTRDDVREMRAEVHGEIKELRGCVHGVDRRLLKIELHHGLDQDE